MASLAGADEGEFADAAAAEAEARWAAGEAGTLESICRDVPAVMASPAARRAVLMCEVCRRTQERRSAVREDMHARFPELREDVDAVIEMAWMMMSAEAGAGSDEGHELREGEQFSRFRLCDRLGGGSFGEVWRAWDVVLERYVALKVLRTVAGDERAFLTEAQAAASIDHAHVVRVHGAGTLYTNGPRYIDSLLVGDPAPSKEDPKAIAKGESLERVFKGKLPTAREAARIMAAAARGVAAAHARGVLHRDLKPGNILLTPSGRPMVADFGLSIPHDEAGETGATEGSTVAGRIVGTPAYMSPEQARGERFTPQSDVYGLGATLRFLLMGRAPYEASGTGGRWSVIRAVRTASAPPLAGSTGVPADLAAICDKAMSAKPEDRYLTPDRMAEDLEAYLAYKPVGASAPGPARRTSLWYRRNRVPATIAVVAVAVLAVTTAAFVASLRSERDRAVEAEREAGLQAHTARAAQAEAVTERDAAVAARETAEAINTFLADCIRAADSLVSDQPTSLREVLSLIEARASRSLERSPRVMAGVLELVAGMREADRFPSAASGSLKRALAVHEREFGAGSAESLRTRRLLYGVMALLGGADRGACERELRAVLEAQRSLLGAEHQETLQTAVAIARILPRERAAEAEEIMRGVVGSLGGESPAPAWQRVKAMRQLALAYAYQGKSEEYTGVQREIVTLLSEELGDLDPETAVRSLEYAAGLRGMGEYEAAAREYVRAAGRIKRVKGRDHPEVVRSLAMAADLYAQRVGYPEAALQLADEVLLSPEGPEERRESRIRALCARAEALIALGQREAGLRAALQGWERYGLRPLGTSGLEARLMRLIVRESTALGIEVTVTGPEAEESSSRPLRRDPTTGRR